MLGLSPDSFSDWDGTESRARIENARFPKISASRASAARYKGYRWNKATKLTNERNPSGNGEISSSIVTGRYPIALGGGGGGGVRK